MQLLFNHIPKTGGITLRSILNRVYGTDKVFLIKSTDIGGSLDLFSSYPKEQRDNFSVVAGHGSGLCQPLLNNPFKITILREPVSLFISQYHFLKTSRDTRFYDVLKGMESLEEYLEFAISNGQDNLLTRYLSNSIHFLAYPSLLIPNMKDEGNILLEKAIKTMHEYDAVIDLADFDAGVFALAQKLDWGSIPLYRTKNRNRMNPGKEQISGSSLNIIKEALKWDIALFENFMEEKIACDNELNRRSMAFRKFQLRQKGVSVLWQIYPSHDGIAR